MIRSSDPAYGDPTYGTSSYATNKVAGPVAVDVVGGVEYRRAMITPTHAYKALTGLPDWQHHEPTVAAALAAREGPPVVVEQGYQHHAANDALPVSRLHPATTRASIGSSAVNLTNTAIGSTVLALPLLIEKCGLGPGIAFLVIGAGMAWFGLYLQTQAAARLGHGAVSWFTMSRKTYPVLRYFVDLAVCILALGTAIAYLIAIGKLMPLAVRGFWSRTHTQPTTIDNQGQVSVGSSLTRREIWIAIAAAIVLPLSFLPHINELRYTSLFGLVIILVLVIATIIEYGTGDLLHPNGDRNREGDNFGLSGLTALPIFLYLFTAHINTFSVWAELKNRNTWRMNVVTSSTMISTFVVYLLIAIFGYLSFGILSGDIYVGDYNLRLREYRAQALFINCVQFIMALHMMTCYPLQAHPFRTAFRDMVAHAFGSPQPHHSRLRKLLHLNKRANGRDWGTHTIATLLFFAITFAIALSIDRFEVVLALIASVCAVNLIITLPALYFYKLSDPLHRPIGQGIMVAGRPRGATIDTNNTYYSNAAVGNTANLDAYGNRSGGVVGLQPMVPAIVSQQGTALPPVVSVTQPGGYPTVASVEPVGKLQPTTQVTKAGSEEMKTGSVMYDNTNAPAAMYDNNKVPVALTDPVYAYDQVDLPPVHPGLRMAALGFAIFGVCFSVYSLIMTILEASGVW